MSTVSKHYNESLQLEEILRQLNHAYPDGPNAYQLAPVDQLHIGGIKASEKLAERLAILKPESVLDIGSGLGGLVRVCKQRHDAIYVGLDITHELSRSNQQLSKLNPTSSPCMIVTGNGQQLPFADESFDVIIMQHSLLNMPDKINALKESKRVLRKGGHLILHEVLMGEHYEQMLFPVPWARTKDISHLTSEKNLIALIDEASLRIESINDWSEEAILWRTRQTNKQTSPQTSSQGPVVSPAMILGCDFIQMSKNVQSNLQNGAIRIVEILIC
jgi:ubiquinone/menaquinone biosynthesis C-methylase UbiE